MGYPELIVALFLIAVPALILYAIIRAGVRAGIRDSKRDKS